MARHTAVIHVEFESEPDGPAPEAIADEITRDVDAFLRNDSAYAPVSSYLHDVYDVAPDTSPTGRWRIGFYLEPPMEEIVEGASRDDALEAFEHSGYGDQAQLMFVRPEER